MSFTIKQIVVAAVSARPFVKAAAAAGYQVIALDVFADSDTQRYASQTHKISYANGGFVPQEFESSLDSILPAIKADELVGFVYGSGFEAQPDLLERIEQRLPLLGNKPHVVRDLKRPSHFFSLLDTLAIDHPEVSFDALATNAGWLQKHAGGSGGTHVLPAPQGLAPAEGYYFQRELRGSPASLLFLADGQRIQAIGFNQQWVEVSPNMPFRYGGIVGHAAFTPSIRQQFIDAAQKLTQAVGLRGLNSLDAIVFDEKIYVLEINPRLSSTFDLYQSQLCNLFDLHVQACRGELMDSSHIPLVSKARQVVYTSHSLQLMEQIAWPAWVADVPMANSHIAADNPVCTVLAEASDAASAHALVLTRKAMVEQIIRASSRAV